MKNIYFYLLLIISGSFSASAQVGINNPNPNATLDVVGNVLVRKHLFLENPSSFSQIRGSKMLIKKTDDEIVQYDIEASKYGPINYVQFVFKSTSPRGIRDYDTKISATDYLVTVQGFYYLIAGSTNTNVTVQNRNDDIYIDGFQMYAYIDTITNTWHIKGHVNNSNFRSGNQDTAIDLYMDLIIFRNGFIAKPLADITIDMENIETKTIAPPSGF